MYRVGEAKSFRDRGPVLTPRSAVQMAYLQGAVEFLALRQTLEHALAQHATTEAGAARSRLRLRKSDARLELVMRRPIGGRATIRTQHIAHIAMVTLAAKRGASLPNG